MKLAEALTHYLSTGASSVDSYAHQELHRFGRAIGLERSVEALAPPEVASYAENVVASGGDIQGRLAPLKEFLTFLKKKGFSTHSLAPHVKIPRATARAAAATKSAFESIEMTATGVQVLRDELDGLKGQREGIIDTIRIAAADKDFKENAPLDAARETQGKAEGRIQEIEETLRRSVVIELKKDPSGIARVGATIVLHDLTTGKNVTYKLVDSTEADPVAGKISVSSPVGSAIVGSRSGDEVEVQAPKGERHYKISSVKF
ncbi:MAG: transcription elongation factor GreA [Dehalococcoidia bacterium]